MNTWASVVVSRARGDLCSSFMLRTSYSTRALWSATVVAMIDPSVSTSIAEIAVSTEVASRRELRRLRKTLRLDGESVNERHRFELTTTPRSVRIGDSVLEVRADFAGVWAMNKLPGQVVSHTPDGGEPVYDSLPEDAVASEAVGRLDLDTTGLLLFTEDGTLSQRLRHPSRNVRRCYRVFLEREADPEVLRTCVASGLTLRNGETVAALGAEQYDDTLWRIWLSEGRYHEVRRIFAAASSHVSALHRESWGPVTLRDGWEPPVARLSFMRTDGAGAPMEEPGESQHFVRLEPGDLQRLDIETVFRLYADAGLERPPCTFRAEYGEP